MYATLSEAKTRAEEWLRMKKTEPLEGYEWKKDRTAKSLGIKNEESQEDCE